MYGIIGDRNSFGLDGVGKGADVELTLELEDATPRIGDLGRAAPIREIILAATVHPHARLLKNDHLELKSRGREHGMEFRLGVLGKTRGIEVHTNNMPYD